MEQTIKLSVIVPVYNVAPYLRDCLDSLLFEIAEDTEIIVVNDGSTDESPAICDEYANNYSQIRTIHQRNFGQSSARNSGLSSARGTYLTFVDSDDYVSMPALKQVVARMEATNADMAIADFTPVKPQMEFREQEVGRAVDVAAQSIGVSGYLKNIQKHTMMVWNKVYRRERVKDVLYPVGAIYEDVFYIKHVLERIDHVIYLPVCTYYYRTQRKGSTAFSFKENRLKGYPFFDDFGKYVRQNFGKEEFLSVATYIADFFQSQYYECALLLGDKRIMKLTLDKYREYVKDTPFRLFPIYRSVFRVSPRLYNFIRNVRNKRWS